MMFMMPMPPTNSEMLAIEARREGPGIPVGQVGHVTPGCERKNRHPAREQMRCRSRNREVICCSAV